MPPSDPELMVWEPPPLDDCDEERFSVPLDPEYLLSVRRVLWHQQLVTFAIILTRRIGDRWLEIVCVDTLHHGCVHRHEGGHAEPYREIRTLYSQQDVQESFNEAYDDVYNAYLKLMGMDELR